MEVLELSRRCEEDGASRIIYTDISRDGTSLGINVGATQRLARAVKIPVIASGGVASVEDIRRLKVLEHDGVEGVIVGRALYTSAFTLKEGITAGS
jgi:phosphoribosylformimino-5-aminoimidazole carboxamide ribotide isomerase